MIVLGSSKSDHRFQRSVRIIKLSYYRNRYWEDLVSHSVSTIISCSSFCYEFLIIHLTKCVISTIH